MTGDFLFKNVPLDKYGRPKKQALIDIKVIVNRYHKNKKEFKQFPRVLYRGKEVYEIESINSILNKSKKKSHNYTSVYKSEIIIQGHLMFTADCEERFIKFTANILRGISFENLKQALIDKKKEPLVKVEELRGKLYIKFTSNVPKTYFSSLVTIKERKMIPETNIQENKKVPIMNQKESTNKTPNQERSKNLDKLVPKRTKSKHKIISPYMETEEKMMRRYEERQRILRLREIENDNELKKKGIYLTHPNAFKRCENCVNFTSEERCSRYNLHVSENHRCRSFYPYKTLLGGAFSPR